MNKYYKSFVLLLLTSNFIYASGRVYLSERIERILNEAKRIRFSDKLAEERYLHCRINQCLNQNRVNLNHLKRKAQNTTNLRNKNLKRTQKSKRTI